MTSEPAMLQIDLRQAAGNSGKTHFDFAGIGQVWLVMPLGVTFQAITGGRPAPNVQDLSQSHLVVSIDRRSSGGQHVGR
jgi:hypothetical protein